MKAIVTDKEMKFLDRNTSEHFGVPSIVLMEQAAIAFVEKLLAEVSQEAPGRMLVLAGTGNNGGDGIAIARLLNQKGIPAEVLFAEDALAADLKKNGLPSEEIHVSDQCRLQRQIYEAYGFPISSPDSLKKTEPVRIIDALFGIGLTRNVEGTFARLIDEANANPAQIISVDLPSGVNGSSGKIMGTAIRAACTITFSYAKCGHYLWPGNECTGKLLIADMGITDASWCGRKPSLLMLEKKDLPDLLPARRDHSNKGSYGKLLLIAGSPGMAGAALLCAKAAMRTGCGLVRILTAEENRIILQTGVPEAILTTYGKKPEEDLVRDCMKWADAVVIGPGLGRGKSAQLLVKTAMDCQIQPMLMDADALNCMAEDTNRFRKPHMDLVITPHLGEMSRLTASPVSYLQENLISSARDFADTCQLACVLKDFRTVTALPYGRTWLNVSGNHGMAAAGSGDVLAGIIGSLLAQGCPVDTAAPLGVFLHGLAGDEAAAEKGKRPMTAGDLIEGLCPLLAAY